jgi:alpha-1,6-mannosyltransferase
MCDDDLAMPAFPLPRAATAGFGGSVLVAFGAAGAGSTPVGDGPLIGTPFEALRYGHGQMLAVGCVYAGVLVLAVAWVQLGMAVRAGTAGLRDMYRTSALWAVPLLICPPLFSRDLYSYVAQGALAANGLDPYTTGSSQLPLALHENVHWVWQDTPTPYGPLHVILTRAVAAVTGEDVVLGVLLTRLVFAAGLVLLAGALPGICRLVGTRPQFALWFAVANPLMLVLVLGGGHNDMLAIGLLASATLFVLRRKAFTGLALLAAAVAVKVTVLVALPFLLWAVSRRLHVAVGKALAAMVPTFLALTLLAGYGFGWVKALSSTGLIVNWMSLPTALGELVGQGLGLDRSDHELLIDCMRAAGMVTLTVLVAVLWWRSRSGAAPVVLRNATLALALAAILLPATLPWYFSWAIALSAVLAWTKARLAGACAGSVWLIVCDYPTGEAAVYDWNYVGVTLAIAALLGAAAAYLEPDRVEVTA